MNPVGDICQLGSAVSGVVQRCTPEVCQHPAPHPPMPRTTVRLRSRIGHTNAAIWAYLKAGTYGHGHNVSRARGSRSGLDLISDIARETGQGGEGRADAARATGVPARLPDLTAPHPEGILSRGLLWPAPGRGWLRPGALFFRPVPGVLR